MDLEHVLFGLSTFVNGCEEKTLNVDNIYKESYLNLLDQLAVLLREESIRDNELIRFNLGKFVDSADFLLSNLERPGYKELLMEVIRVLVNSIADNDYNRKQLATKTNFITHIGEQLGLDSKDVELNDRLLILLKNLVIDSPELVKDISFLTQILLNYINESKGPDNEIFLALDLLSELVKEMNYRPDTALVQNLIKLLRKSLKNDNNLSQDEITDLVLNISGILEAMTLDPRFNFSDAETEKSLQVDLLVVLNEVKTSIEQNMLMVNRKIFATIGNISANLSTSNLPLREYSLSKIRDPKEENGYIISASLTIIGNSISSSEDRNKVLDEAPTLIDEVLSKYNHLVDPIQFQGILHLLKMLISFDTVGSLFTEKNFKILEALIEATVRNSKYYTNFNSLLAAFLKKLFVLVNQKHVEKIMKSDIPKILTSSDFNNQINLIILLLLNKVAVYQSDEDIDLLCSKVFKFTNDVQVDYLFELTKTIGVLLQHNSTFILHKYSSVLITLLTTIDSIDPDSNDNASKAVLNNGRYIAGSLLNIGKESEIDPELISLSLKLLNK